MTDCEVLVWRIVEDVNFWLWVYGKTIEKWEDSYGSYSLWLYFISRELSFFTFFYKTQGL